MASVISFLKEIRSLNYYIQTENEIAQEVIIKYYCAARCIQRWVRGYISRKHLKELHKAATVIQTFWRAVLARNHIRKLLEARIRENSKKYYDSKATLIQKTWRGHRVRSNTFNYFQLKEYLRSVGEENEKIWNKMEDYQCTSFHYEQQKYEEAVMHKIQRMLQELHHMLRTRVTPGVFSLYNQSNFSELEMLIASITLPESRRMKGEVKRKSTVKIGKLMQGPFLPNEELTPHRKSTCTPSMQVPNHT